MQYDTLMWVALLAGAVGTGASFVGILAARRSLEGVFALTGLVSFVLCAWGFGAVSVAYDRLDAILYGLAIGLAGIAGGYALVSTMLGWLASHDRRLTLPDPDTIAQHPERVAVLLLGEVEPAQYSPRATAAALDDLAEEGLLKASVGVLPFLFMAQKTRYRAAGGTSPAAKQLDLLAERLESVLSLAPGSSVVAAWCSGDRSLASRIVELARGGVSHVVVAQTEVAESLEVDAAKRLVDSLRLDDIGVQVAYTGPVWKSERVANLVATRTAAVGADPATTGLVLVGQGQPDERARDRGEFDQEETSFLNRVRMILVDQGLPEQNVRIAWADWRSPDVTGAVRHLAALGCRRIVVSPACFPLDSITTLLDLQLAVRQARVDETVSVITLPAWQDDPGFVEELRGSVTAALAAMALQLEGETA